MSTIAPRAGIAQRGTRPQPPQRPAPAPVEDDLGAAFDTPAPTGPTTRQAPAAPVRKTIASRQAPAQAAPARPAAPTPRDILQEFGTKGMPHEQAQTVGLKGSEVYGGPPPSGTDKIPPAPKRAPSVKEELGPEYARVTAARATRTKVAELVRPINDTDEAIALLMETNEVEAPDYQTLFTRDYCFRLLITDAAAMVSMARDVLVEQMSNLSKVALGTGVEVDSAVATNVRFERAVGAAAPPLGVKAIGAAPPADPFGDDIFGGSPSSIGAGETQVTGRGVFVGVVNDDDAVYLFPSGVKLSLKEFRELLLRYARAPFPTQGKMEKNLGYEVHKHHAPTVRAIKGEAQEATKEQMAHQLALNIIAAIQATQPPSGPKPPTIILTDEDAAAAGEEFDFDDDGSEAPVAGEGAHELTYEPAGSSVTPLVAAGRRQIQGRVGRQAPSPDPRVAEEDEREKEYEDRKKMLQHRAQSLVCYECKYTATGHHKLSGENVKHGQKLCEGFVANTEADRDALITLTADAETFRATFPDLIERDKAALKTKVEGAAAAAEAPKRAGDVRGGPQSAGGSVGQSPGAAGQQGQPSRVHGEPDGGGHSAPAGGASGGPQQGGLATGGGGGPQEGADTPQTPAEYAAAYNLTPPEVRAAYDQQRREWFASTPGLEEVTARMLWDINYPHTADVNYNLPAPRPYAVDEMSVERREKVVGILAANFDKGFFGPQGQLRDDIEYGSVSWRVFVAAWRLAEAVEGYATARGDAVGQEAWNKVKRHAKGYLDAHRPAGQDEFDPDVTEYIAWLTEAQKPFGTAVEDLMGQ